MSKKHKRKKKQQKQGTSVQGCMLEEVKPEVKEQSVYTHTYTFGTGVDTPFWGSVWSDSRHGSTWSQIVPSSPKGENTCRALVPYGYCFDATGEKEGTLEYV